MRKSTNKELVEELEKRNTEGKYDKLIENAKNNRYHDYKNPNDVVCGKLEFAADVAPFPELQDLAWAVRDGDYDEEMDEADKEMMRRETPKSMWPMLGLQIK